MPLTMRMTSTISLLFDYELIVPSAPHVYASKRRMDYRVDTSNLAIY